MVLQRLKPGALAGTLLRRVAIAASLIALSASSLANPDYETIEYTQSDRTSPGRPRPMPGECSDGRT